jgi:ribosomal protein S1
MKFVPNIEKLKKENNFIEEQITDTKQVWGFNNWNLNDNSFSIKDIKIWSWYEWYVKLSYNYGMFITVKWVEGLLHKNFIVAPEWVEWKKYYNIWDKIKVKAKEFKIINDEKKVVWSQK